MARPESIWKSHYDPVAQKIFYLNTTNNVTQWEKPDELMTPEELLEKETKKLAMADFFRQMEANIQRKLEKGLSSVDISSEEMLHSNSNNNAFSSHFSYDDDFPPTNFVRTISKLDDSLFNVLSRTNSMEDISSPVKLRREGESKSFRVEKEPPKLRRRNSTSTIYLDTTISAPDKPTTIRCVCTVFRAHLLQAAKENQPPNPEFQIFVDNEYQNRQLEVSDSFKARRLVPTLDTITKFFSDIYEQSEMEIDCIIMPLIYLERLLKATNGALQFRHYNWKSILLSCLVLSSKVWDDLSMWNGDFSHICPSFTLSRINDLESAVLNALKFYARVSASEYAKYYFHLRSRIGLFKTSQDKLSQPLCLEEAKQLHTLSEEFKLNDRENGFVRRSISLHEGADRSYMEGLHNFGPEFADREFDPEVSIEQIVHMNLTSTDGTPRNSEQLKKTKKPFI